MEVELFTLDNSGKVINAADKLIKRVKESEPEIDINKECAHNMVELGSFPSVNVPNTMETLLKNFESLLHHAEKEEIVIFPLGTYPGKFTPKMRSQESYKIKKGIFGKKRFEIAGRCIGFHCHYALPWGVFDSKKLRLKKLVDSKNKKSMVDSYNLMVAMDPALTTFMQSSPFYQGRFIGKDSRTIVYRGGKALRYKEGLYSKHHTFGSLPAYKHTGTDLINYISNRYKKWKKIVDEAGVKTKKLSKRGSILDTMWTAVKVNSHGTLEQRGLDVNHPLLIIATSTLMKVILRKVQEDFIDVVPSDIGIKEPFKFEGKKVYIPPSSHVRNKLQRFSAYEGMDNDDIHNYCKRLLKTAEDLSDKGEIKFLDPLKDMIRERKTTSDTIIDEAKKKGWKKDTALPQKIAAEIALDHSKQLFKEIVLTRKKIEDVLI